MRDKNKIDDQFTEFAWSEMSKVLDKEMPQKKRNRTVFFWLFGIGFLAAIAFLYLNYNTEPVEMASAMQVEQTNDLQSSESELSIVENQDVTKESKANNEQLTTEEPTTINYQSTTKKIPTKNQKPKTKTTPTITQQPITKASSIVVEQPTTNNQQRTTKTSSVVINPPTTINVQVETEEPTTNNQQQITKKITTNSQQPATEESSIVVNSSTTINEQLGTEEPPTTNTLEPTSKESSIVVNPPTIINEQVATEEPPTTNNQQSTEELSTNNEESSTTDDKEILNNKKKWSFGLNALGYVNKEFAYINDWEFGVFTKRDLNDKFALSLGVGYTNVLFTQNDSNGSRGASDDLAISEMEEDNPATAGGDMNNALDSIGTISDQILNSDKVRNHFINVPLSLYFRINRRMDLTAGAGAEFLLSQVEGDGEAFNKINPYFHAGANFNITDKLTLGLSYKFIGSRFKDNNAAIPASSFDLINKGGSFPTYRHLFGLKLGYTIFNR